MPSGRCTTWRSRRACSRSWSRASAPGCAQGARVVDREAVRPRPGVGRGAQPRRCTRSSPRPRSFASTTTSARRRCRTCCTSASPIRSSSRSGTATTSPACRSPWPRASACRAAASSTRRSARSATSSRTTCCRSSACWRWSRRSAPTREALRDEKVKVLQGDAPARAPTDLVRGQFQGYRDEPGVAADSDVETFAARARSPSTPGAGAGCPGTCAPASACR